MKAIERAVKAIGGRKELAKEIGVTYQAVEKWVRFNRVPADRVLQIEKASGVSRHDLRPDIYPRETHRAELRIS